MDADIACLIKGAHLTEEQSVDYLRGHKYYREGKFPIKSVIIEDHGYVMRTELDGEDNRDYECEGKYAWIPCGSQDEGAVPATVIGFIEYGEDAP
jgi:hypothetical protein